MADRFLREVKRMHQLRRDINEMTPEEADELIRGLGDDAAEDWVFAARDAQLPPPDLSWCWLFLGGRGAGKSHSMSAAVHTAVRAGISRIHDRRCTKARSRARSAIPKRPRHHTRFHRIAARKSSVICASSRCARSPLR